MNKEFAKYAAKFITAVVGAAALAVTQGLISGTAAKWVAIGIGVLTAAGVYVVPNTSLSGRSTVSEPPPTGSSPTNPPPGAVSPRGSSPSTGTGPTP